MSRPSIRNYFENWRASDASAAAKSRMVVRNSLRRLKTGSRCCGNHGEPGC